MSVIDECIVLSFVSEIQKAQVHGKRSLGKDGPVVVVVVVVCSFFLCFVSFKGQDIWPRPCSHQHVFVVAF